MFTAQDTMLAPLTPHHLPVLCLVLTKRSPIL